MHFNHAIAYFVVVVVARVRKFTCHGRSIFYDILYQKRTQKFIHISLFMCAKENYIFLLNSVINRKLQLTYIHTQCQPKTKKNETKEI